MSTELHMLIWASALGLVQLIISALPTVIQLGLPYALGARDEQKRLAGVGARISRAFSNFVETFAFFIAAVVLVQMLDKHTAMTALGAQLYFWARLIYVPLYAIGTPVLRTLCWTVSIVGIVMMLGSVL
jgi:uncharacterized MAPEG superfamily protein